MSRQTRLSPGGFAPRKKITASAARPVIETASWVRRCSKGEVSLAQAAAALGVTYAQMKELCKPQADDPLLQMAGVLETELSDIAEKHDDYLGRQLKQELTPDENG